VLSAIQGRASQRGDRHQRALTGVLGVDIRGFAWPSRMSSGCPAEQARVTISAQGYRRPGSQAMVSCPSWEPGLRGVLSKDGEGGPLRPGTRAPARSVGDQLAHAGGNALEEPARVELVPIERRRAAMDHAARQVDVDRSHAWLVARRGRSSPRLWSRCYPCEPGQRTRIPRTSTLSY